MKQWLENFLCDLKRQTPLPACFVVAYSGGVDSTVLLHALNAMGLPVHALHVNHQLQATANDWELHCQTQCKQWGLPFTALKVTVQAGGGMGLEGQARVMRYRAILEWMSTFHHTVLLCAHHLDDQLETILLQLFRGSGLRGVAGMRGLGPVGVDRHLHPHVLLGRPFLSCSKSQLLAYAKQHTLTYVIDPSNSDTQLRRNWVRHELLPSLAQHFPQSPKALLGLAMHFQAHCAEQDAQVQRLATTIISPLGALELVPWRELGERLQVEALRYWLLGQGVRCGKLKLIELARQLRIHKGGIRSVNQGWQVDVRQQQAVLQVLSNARIKC